MRIVIATPTRDARADDPARRRRPACPRSARSPWRSSSARWTTSSTTSSARARSCRSASSAASTPATPPLRTAIAGGSLGRLLVARLATHDPAPPSEAYIAGSGGIFRDLHIHDFDALRFVTGEEIVEVYADGAVRETPWFGDHDDVDVAVAVLRLSGGALAILSGTRHDALGYDVRLEAFGMRDSVVAGIDPRSPLRSLEPGVAQPSVPAYGDFMQRFQPAYEAELAAFVATVIDGGPSACTLHEARAALLVALAADRSKNERRPVAPGEIAHTQVIAG